LFAGEMSNLPKELGLSELSFQGAIDIGQSPSLKAFLCLICTCISKRKREEAFNAEIKRTFTPSYEKHGEYTVFQCAASGTNAEGKQFSKILRFTGTKGGNYHLTAMAVLAAIEQIVDGSIKGNAPPEFAALRMDPEASVRSVAGKPAITYEEMTWTGPPCLVKTEATAIARNAVISFRGAMSWFMKFLIFGLSLWAASTAQSQTDTTKYQLVLSALVMYVLYYAAHIWFFIKVVICGSAYEVQSFIVRFIDWIWFCSGYWIALCFVYISSSAELSTPEMKRGLAVASFAVVANLVDVLVLQINMYTSDEWNVLLCAMYGGVYGKPNHDATLQRPLLA